MTLVDSLDTCNAQSRHVCATAAHLSKRDILLLQLAAACLGIHHSHHTSQLEAAAGQQGGQRLNVSNTRRLQQLHITSQRRAANTQCCRFR